MCVVPTSGQSSCQAIPIKIVMTAPAAGARVGQAGIAVAAEVTLGSPDATPPSSLVVFAASTESGSIALTSRDGVRASYAGTYKPQAALSFTGTFFVAERTNAGLVPSDGVLVTVDTKAPSLTGIGAGCGAKAACARDDLLQVIVSAADENLDTVEATLDLDGDAKRVTLPPGALEKEFVGAIPLAGYPLPRFSGTVRARVLARDSFGNGTTIDLPAFPVTRKRWEHDSGAPAVAGPAVAADGSIVIAVNATADQLRAIARDGTEAWRATLGSRGVTSAPSIGASTVWVGSDDGRLYGRTPTSGTTGSIFACPSAGAIEGAMFTPAVLLLPSESAYSSGITARLNGAANGSCLPASGVTTTDPATAAPETSTVMLFVATSRAAQSTLRRFSSVPAEEASASTSCAAITAPPAIRSDGNILMSCAGGEIVVADKATLSPTVLATLPDFAQESIVILPLNDLIVGANDNKVHRLTPPGTTGTWTEKWSPAPDLGSPVTGTLVAQADVSTDPLVYAVTQLGQLYALDAAGGTVWTTAGDASSPTGTSRLTFPTIAPADPASPNTLPTLYVGSAGGKLYAIVVDKGLDTTSPWPKSHHDIRNTGNADATLP